MAAASKILNIDGFARVTSTFTFVPVSVRGLLPLLIPLAEVFAAYLLLLPATRKVGLHVSFGMLLVFTGYLGWLVADPYAPACNCLGLLTLAEDARLANRLALLRNIVLLVINALGLFLLWYPARRRTQRSQTDDPPKYAAAVSRAHGFTLAELLVVIGVIGLLLAILLPVLNVVRASARELQCASQQREIAAAALSGVAETGYLPLTGSVVVPADTAGRDSLPRALNDSSRRRYAYAPDRFKSGEYFGPFLEQVLPPAYALLRRLEDVPRDPGVPEEWNTVVSRHPLLRLFECPSETFRDAGHTGNIPSRREPAITFSGEDGSSDFWHTVWSTGSDYAFNGGVMGFHHERTYSASRQRGRAAGVRDPSTVVLFADAEGHRWAGGPTASLQPTLFAAPTRVTLRDVVERSGRMLTRTPLAPDRHRGRINVAFADGHVAAVVASPEALDEAVLLHGE